jgi:hypothetical protein
MSESNNAPKPDRKPKIVQQTKSDTEPVPKTFLRYAQSSITKTPEVCCNAIYGAAAETNESVMGDPHAVPCSVDKRLNIKATINGSAAREGGQAPRRQRKRNKSTQQHLVQFHRRRKQQNAFDRPMSQPD